MTDARLPDRWMCDRRLHHLKDPDYRSFLQALIWAVANRTDGVVEPDDVEVVPDFARASITDLVSQGLWIERSRGGWQIADWVGTQTTRAEHETLEKARARERQKKARQRAKAAATTDIPGDSTGGRSRGTTQEGRQAGRPKQATIYVSGAVINDADYIWPDEPADVVDR